MRSSIDEFMKRPQVPFNSALYLQGGKDCEAGKEPQSNDENYLSGYSTQYAFEQQRSAKDATRS